MANHSAPLSAIATGPNVQQVFKGQYRGEWYLIVHYQGDNWMTWKSDDNGQTFHLWLPARSLEEAKWLIDDEHNPRPSCLDER